MVEVLWVIGIICGILLSLAAFFAIHTLSTPSLGVDEFEAFSQSYLKEERRQRETRQLQQERSILRQELERLQQRGYRPPPAMQTPEGAAEGEDEDEMSESENTETPSDDSPDSRFATIGPT